MQGLFIQALALRQFQRWSTHKLLTPGQGPYWTLHTHQLCGSSMTIETHKLPTRWISAKTWSGLHQAVQDEEEDDEKDPDVPKDYKDMEKYAYLQWLTDYFCLCFCKVEDALYGNKLWLNGQKFIKKSKFGSYFCRKKDTVTLLRVIIKKELGKSKDGDQYNVVMRRWKNLELPKQDAFKQ
uniref:Mitochondrial transcription rescue factor 1 C-terminal domain-containing protein n=1 Tax=Hucho hucho TaxID=62062 RepID=A0A4W5PSN4_9TELE